MHSFPLLQRSLLRDTLHRRHSAEEKLCKGSVKQYLQTDLSTKTRKKLQTTHLSMIHVSLFFCIFCVRMSKTVTTPSKNSFLISYKKKPISKQRDSQISMQYALRRMITVSGFRSAVYRDVRQLPQV